LGRPCSHSIIKDDVLGKVELLVSEFVGPYIGERLLDWAISCGLEFLVGTEKDRDTQAAFEDAASEALADVWDESVAQPHSESSRVLAEHMSTWLTEPSVADMMFRAANGRRKADSKGVVKLIEHSGFDVSWTPFDMEDFVAAFIPRLGEVVDQEIRSQGLSETAVIDKLNELLDRIEPRESAIRAAISEADGPDRRPILVGIRSFTRRAEDMDEEMNALLRLENHFDGRHIKSAELWHKAVYPELETFLERNLNGRDRHLLHLSTHMSIAFACGYLLDPKSGVDVVPVQRTSGKQEWHPAVDPSEARLGLPGELWNMDPVPLRADRQDLVIALSVTQDVFEDVAAYAQKNLPSASRILNFEVSPGASQFSVRSGTHALLLAEDLMTRFKDARSSGERVGTVHRFAAAPTGFMFFAGRFARGLGRCMVYEFDFESGGLGAYEPALMFPPPEGEAEWKTEPRGG
jgi:hypothetical protein